ncbi:UNKNOWN [Stylonychia lemnae]|uniref:Uncharacterized protein n=1 Tax=Stylonychia lemnae TaxID=5949 RepID=A0A078ASA4_STYLE|nr:UNKNOWN [Stylonychia lemnae]|eukprot:CDW85345.1 UNKNOWN [Stylonychia lemnae]
MIKLKMQYLIIQAVQQVTDDDEVVSLEYVNKKADSLLRWANTLDKQIFSEKQLRKNLLKIKMNDKDIDILITHMRFKNLLKQTEVIINGQKTNLIKLNTYQTKEDMSITDKEKATFVLQQNIEQIDDKIDQLHLKIEKINQDVQKSIKMKSTKNGIVLLSQRKKLVAFWERLTTQKHLLEDQLMNIEELQSQSVIYDALNLAEQAGKSLNKDIDQYEDLFDKMEEQQQNQRQINEFIQEKSSMSKDEEASILKELEELEAGNVIEELNYNPLPVKEPAFEKEKSKQDQLDQELELLEQQLAELNVVGDDSSQQTEASLNRNNQEESKEQIGLERRKTLVYN